MYKLNEKNQGWRKQTEEKRKAQIWVNQTEGKKFVRKRGIEKLTELKR